jgi:hypothetical protein
MAPVSPIALWKFSPKTKGRSDECSLHSNSNSQLTTCSSSQNTFFGAFGTQWIIFFSAEAVAVLLATICGSSSGPVYIDTQKDDGNINQTSITTITLHEGVGWEHLSPFHNVPTCF